MQIGEEQDPVELPVPVHPDQIPLIPAVPEPAVPEPAVPERVPA
jgi:hypothetical protein